VLRKFGRPAAMLATLELSLLEIRPFPFSVEISVLELMQSLRLAEGIACSSWGVTVTLKGIFLP
jgi:hypothetical protein